MTYRGGKISRLLNTDSSLDSLKISTNFTTHREKRPDIIKVEEFQRAEDGWRRFNSVTSMHSSGEKDHMLLLGQTIASTSTANTSKTK